LLLRRSFADQITDDHLPGGDPDPPLELGGFDIEASDRIDGAQSRPHRALGIVLMRFHLTTFDAPVKDGASASTAGL
jgi:hypothetical protein